MSKVPLTQDQARRALSDNTHRIPWNDPDKIIVDRTMVSGERQTGTLIDVLCVAYDLKPNK